MKKALAVILMTAAALAGVTVTHAAVKPLTWLESCYGPQSLYNDGTTAAWAATWADCGPPYRASYGTPLPASTAYYADYGKFAADLAAGRLAGYKWALLDLEQWSATPPAQQAGWKTYQQMFCQQAHAAGMKCILTPCACLVNGWTNWLKANGPGWTARYADVFDIQAQTYETNLSGQPGSYNYDVRMSSQQALAANPAVQVIAGLHGQAGGCNGTDITPAQTQAAYNAAYPYVTGFWLNNDCYVRGFTDLLNSIYG